MSGSKTKYKIPKVLEFLDRVNPQSSLAYYSWPDDILCPEWLVHMLNKQNISE